VALIAEIYIAQYHEYISTALNWEGWKPGKWQRQSRRSRRMQAGLVLETRSGDVCGLSSVASDPLMKTLTLVTILRPTVIRELWLVGKGDIRLHATYIEPASCCLFNTASGVINYTLFYSSVVQTAVITVL